MAEFTATVEYSKQLRNWFVVKRHPKVSRAVSDPVWWEYKKDAVICATEMLNNKEVYGYDVYRRDGSHERTVRRLNMGGNDG